MGKEFDLLGKVFGNLTVVSYLGIKKRVKFWLCKCVCGGETETRTTKLLMGHTKSCGCIQRKLSGERLKLEPYAAVYNHLLRCAEARHIKAELTYIQFLEFTKIKNCTYCTVDIKWSKHRVPGGTYACNLDRVDNTKGYSTENCVVCCKFCNWAKKSRSKEDFLLWVSAIYNNKALKIL